MVAEEVRGKGKRGLLRIIFGRTTFFILFMALQIAVLAWIYFWLDDRYQAYGYGAFGLVSAVLAIRILNEKQNASFKMAWLVPVLLFPVFGCLFYIFVQLQMETKILAKRIADIRIRTRSYLNQNEAIAAKLMKENRRNANLSRYLSERAGYPVYDRTNFKYYPLGDDFFPDLLEELKAAERFIFLEYFIIQRGEMWDSVLKILEEKAAAGVDVRVLYDGMNISQINKDFRINRIVFYEIMQYRYKLLVSRNKRNNPICFKVLHYDCNKFAIVIVFKKVSYITRKCYTVLS